jgi:hypothetical protein
MAPVREGGAQICICSQSGTDMMSIDIPLWSLLWYFGSCGCLYFGGQVLTGAMREVDPFSRELRSSAMREGQPGRAAALSRAHRYVYTRACVCPQHNRRALGDPMCMLTMYFSGQKLASRRARMRCQSSGKQGREHPARKHLCKYPLPKQCSPETREQSHTHLVEL